MTNAAVGLKNTIQMRYDIFCASNKKAYGDAED